MQLDGQLVFSDDQAITSTGATASSNIIDLGSSGRRKFGGGGLEPLQLLALVTTTFTSGGSATMSITVQSDDDSAFGSPTTIAVSEAIAVATLVAGYEFEKLDLSKITERYVRVVYTVATAAMTAGKMVTALMPNGSIQRGIGQS